jgi:hypothetical protein
LKRLEFGYRYLLNPGGFALPHAAIAVFTSKSIETLLSHGGSGPWVGAEQRVHQQKYLVCVRKTKPGTEGHGGAFLVGKIREVRKLGFDRRGQQRWFFEISEFAVLDDDEGHWEWRNPVRYTTLEELGIELKKLKFKPAPPATLSPPMAASGSNVKPLTIAEAKAGLAAKFGVSPEAIDIHIKG